MRPLTTDWRVWRIQISIAIIISIAVGICFYFTSLFLAFVIACTLLLISTKIAYEYHQRTKDWKISPKLKTFYGYLLLGFWLFATIVLLGYSIDQVGATVLEIHSGDQQITQIYLLRLERFLPQIVMDLFITTDNIQMVQAYIIGLFTTVVSELSSFIVQAVLIIPLVFYMYHTKRRIITRQVIHMIPPLFRESVKSALTEIYTKMDQYFTAKLVESIIVGAICCFGFYVAGLQGWLILGVIAGFLNIIPYLGPLLGAVPALLVALLDEPIVVVFVLVTIIIAQLVDNLYLIPFMISNRVAINPLIGIVLVLVGAKLFGPLGMIFAIPVYMVYTIVLRSSYEQLVRFYHVHDMGEE